LTLEGKTQKDYEDAKDKFCRDNPDLTIFLAGEVSHPGISDLDFVVVDDIPYISPDTEEFLMGGNVIVMPRKVMPQIRLIENFSLHFLQGENIEISENNEQYFDLVEVIEWLPERILLLESLDIKSIAPQQLLLYLKSADRSIKNVEKLTGYEFSRISTEDLRANYKNIDLDQVAKNYMSACILAWEAFSETCVVCIPNISGKASISDYYSFDHVRFPLLLSYLNVLASAGSDLSIVLKERLEINRFECKFDSKFLQFIKKRFSLIDDVYEFHVSKGSKRGMIKYGWLL
jgi:hypothetical protein